MANSNRFQNSLLLWACLKELWGRGPQIFFKKLRSFGVMCLYKKSWSKFIFYLFHSKPFILLYF